MMGGTSLEHTGSPKKDGPLFPALFSLNMLLGTQSVQSYSENQIMGMLARAGIEEIGRVSVPTPNGSGVIVGLH